MDPIIHAKTELLKKENKRIRSWWQTCKHKLSAAREELQTVRDLTGKHTSHSMKTLLNLHNTFCCMRFLPQNMC